MSARKHPSAFFGWGPVDPWWDKNAKKAAKRRVKRRVKSQEKRQRDRDDVCRK